MKLAKTIDQLYEEVRDFDYVITNDAALATALNARIDVCKIDGFAYTPKTIAGIIENTILKEKALNGLETVEEIERQTDYDFKYIHSEISNIKDIRKYTADVKAYLPSKKSQKVFEVFDSLPTSTKVMSIFEPSIYRTFLSGKKIAVIGIDLFNDLDKHFIPVEYTEIDLFTREDFEIDTINAIGNDRQIAGSIVDLITEDNCMDTAIVLDTGGPISDAVRAALYRKKIPFKNDIDVKDLSQVRDFIQFLSLALDYKTIRVGDVRELFSVYQTGSNKNSGEELTPDLDNYLLCRVPFKGRIEPVTERLIDTMKSITEVDFEYAAEMLFGNLSKKTSVMMVLKSLNLSNRKITPKLVNRLSYAVNNVEELKHNDEVPENERKGVLLVDCKNSIYVDRSFVIFIGMDESWEVTAPGKDYVDKEKLDEDNALRLSILLQQGNARIYAVKPVTKGKDTLPCPTFQTIYSSGREMKEIGSFRDLCRNYVGGSWFKEKWGPEDDSDEEELEVIRKPWRFSKSSYNNYSDCPIKFMFSKLVSSGDNEYTVFGNCIHEFAEFYFCYPELVNEKGLEHYITELEERYAGMSNKCEKSIDTSRIRVYLRNVVRFIDRIRPEVVPLDRALPEKNPNMFMVAEGLRSTSPYTESPEECENAPVFAKFDVCFDSFIGDYKSGKSKTSKDIIKGFTRRGKNLSEFQALIYLYALGQRTSARPCTFNLLFIGDNDIASISEDFDIMRNVRTVRYCSEDLVTLALGPDGTLRDAVSSAAKYQPFIDNWGTVSDILVEYAQYGNFDAESCTNALINGMGLKDNKGSRNLMADFMKKLRNVMDSPYLIDAAGTVIVPSDSMNRFIAQVAEDLETAENERSIPIYKLDKGKMNCKKCAYYKICLKANVADGEEEEE